MLLMVSNHGSGARLLRSSGWNGDSLAFQNVPELQGAYGLERVTFTARKGGGFDWSYVMSKDGRRWKTGNRQTFTQVSIMLSRR